MKISKPTSPTSKKNSSLNISDKSFVEFCRCLYQAKAVVRELESFSATVSPALSQYPKFIEANKEVVKHKDGILLQQVNHYLNTTFRKFTRLCKLLMVVLTQMEASSSGKIKRERIDSFRFEVWEEWKTATSIKQRLIHFTQLSDFQDQTVYTRTTTTTTTTTTTKTSEKESSTTTTTTSSSSSTTTAL